MENEMKPDAVLGSKMLSDFKGGNVTSGVADGVAEGLAETAGVPEAAGAVLGITVVAVVFTGLTFAFVTLTLQTRVNFFFCCLTLQLIFAVPFFFAMICADFFVFLPMETTLFLLLFQVTLAFFAGFVKKINSVRSR